MFPPRNVIGLALLDYFNGVFTILFGTERVMCIAEYVLYWKDNKLKWSKDLFDERPWSFISLSWEDLFIIILLHKFQFEGFSDGLFSHYCWGRTCQLIGRNSVSFKWTGCFSLIMLEWQSLMLFVCFRRQPLVSLKFCYYTVHFLW